MNAHFLSDNLTTDWAGFWEGRNYGFPFGCQLRVARMFCPFLQQRRDLRLSAKGRASLDCPTAFPLTHSRFPPPTAVPPPPHTANSRRSAPEAPPLASALSRRGGAAARWHLAAVGGGPKASVGRDWLGRYGQGGGKEGDGCRACAGARGWAAWEARSLGGEGDGSSMAAGYEPPNPFHPRCRRRRRSRWDPLVCVY